MRVILIAMVISKTLLASWYCTDVASERKGNSIYACGIGSGLNEDTARTEAFKNSEKEFKNICLASTDCRGKSYNAEPLRSECNSKDGLYTCHRLVIFSIGGVSNETPGYYPEKVIQKKLRKGMTVNQAMGILGKPKKFEETDNFGTKISYLHYDCDGRICNGYPHFAMVFFKNGKLDKIDNVNVDYIEF